MTRFKIQTFKSLCGEMRAVARGEHPAPRDAGVPTFESVDALLYLLTPENRELLALIRDHKPQSVAQLAQLSGRAQPNLTRTLAKLAAAGFITMQPSGQRRKAPRIAVKKITIEVDPCSYNDRLSVA